MLIDGEKVRIYLTLNIKEVWKFKYDWDHQVINQKMDPAWDEILGQSYEAYLATGPVMALPLVYPLLLTMTPALSSK